MNGTGSRRQNGGDHTLLNRVNWTSVNERVKHEQRNREVYVPPISLFRWWARRPHALIGALIDAAAANRRSLVISDPFSGGGTVAMEAARRGFGLYAQDLHPWAIAGLAAALDDVDPEMLGDATSAVLRALEERCRPLYATACPVTEHTDSELVHVFWVRSKQCAGCGEMLYLYPYSLVTLASRRRGETEAFFGCSRCGSVSRHPMDSQARRRCPSCRVVLPDPNEPLLPDRTVTCPGCETTDAAFTGAPPDWKVVMVYRSCKQGDTEVQHFDAPAAAESQASPIPSVRRPLREAIPEGVETSLLRRAGFRRWMDMYPPRQLEILLAAVDVVDRMKVSEAIRTRLLLAISGAAEMAGFLSRWDRYYPKAFEAVANHRFAALGLACESNLLAHRGRGTLRRRFAQSVAAARWSGEHIGTRGRALVLHAGARRRRVTSYALLGVGSSERQLPSDASVDLVLTDPPYFDDIQYAELASLFLVWARALNLVPRELTVDLQSEAVVNSQRGTGMEEYRALLTKIFREARRTLRPRGRLVLTFHNTDVRAWWALAQALWSSGFSVSCIAVAEAENARDHPKRGSRSFTRDLVIECRPTRRGQPLRVMPHLEDEESDELRAAGRTVAVGGQLSFDGFVHRLRLERGSVRHPRIKLVEAVPSD